jgi:hypothetical protein
MRTVIAAQRHPVGVALPVDQLLEDDGGRQLQVTRDREVNVRHGHGL